MSIENISPTLFSMGSGGLIGFLVGFAVKRIFKILAVMSWRILWIINVSSIAKSHKRKLGQTPGNVTVDCNNSSPFTNGRGTDLYDKREFGHTLNRRLGDGLRLWSDERLTSVFLGLRKF